MYQTLRSLIISPKQRHYPILPTTTTQHKHNKINTLRLFCLYLPLLKTTCSIVILQPILQPIDISYSLLIFQCYVAVSINRYRLICIFYIQIVCFLISMLSPTAIMVIVFFDNSRQQCSIETAIKNIQYHVSTLRPLFCVLRYGVCLTVG